jgi:hypothetical protein
MILCYALTTPYAHISPLQFCNGRPHRTLILLGRRGRVVRGMEHVARSRYEEDVHPQNHTSVWGSFWANGSWGYACCKSTNKNSMCLGAKAEQVRLQNEVAMAANEERAVAERAAAASAAEANGAASLHYRSWYQTRAGALCAASSSVLYATEVVYVAIARSWLCCLPEGPLYLQERWVIQIE